MEGLNPPPVTDQKNSKVTLNVDSCVASVPIVTGLPQRKGVNPNACQLYTKIKYVKNVFCVGHLSSVNLVTNAQHAVIDPPVGARLQQCWEKWETLGSKVVNILREGYMLPFWFRPHLTRSPTVISNYHNRTGGESKNLPPSRGVGHIYRFQRRILPHTSSQSVQEVHAFSHPGSVLPVQGPTLWSVHSPHGVHSGGQRGQTHGTSEGYKDPPVPRRLAGESLYPPHLSPAYSNPSHTLSGIRVAGEQGKVRNGSQTGLQLRRLPVRPERGQGQTNRRALASLDTQDQINIVGSTLPGPTIHVPCRSTLSNRKASPLRATTHETHTVSGT